MSCTVIKENKAKNYIPCVWGKAYNRAPHPDSAPSTWGFAKLVCQNAKMSRQIEAPEWGGGGGVQICHFSNNSTMKQYFKMLISHGRQVFLALSLLQCQSLPISFTRAVKRENVAYIVKLTL